MDLSATSWISEMGLEDISFSDQYDILDDLFDEDFSAAIGHQEDMQNSWSQEFNSSSYSSTLMPRSNSTTSLCTSSSMFLDAQNNIGFGLDETPPPPPTAATYLQQPNFENLINGENSFTPSPMILTFGNTKAPQTNGVQHVNPEVDGAGVLISSRSSYVNLEEAGKKTQATKKTTRTRPASQTYDHIIAERKRREQLSQQFVALSAIVPGLKKMDKTSVLGDAINYMKKLQERVNTLEEKASKQKMKSLVLVKKTQVVIDEDEGCINSDDERGSYDEQHLPEIEAKLCDKNVLLRIQCEKHKGVLGKIFSVIQKLKLAIINTNVTPFGNMALDITIVAQMDKELNLTMKELVKSLRSALMLQ